MLKRIDSIITLLENTYAGQEKIVQLLEKFYDFAQQQEPLSGEGPAAPLTVANFTPGSIGCTAYTEPELITMRDASIALNVSRSTLNELRKEGKLTTVYNKRNIRLLRTEVEAARLWYSIPKGKV